MTEITLTLRDLRGEGGAGYPYRLTVEPHRPDRSFQLAPADDQINIPKGGTAAVAVEVTRPGLRRADHPDLRRPPSRPDRPPGLINRRGRRSGP